MYANTQPLGTTISTTNICIHKYESSTDILTWIYSWFDSLFILRSIWLKWSYIKPVTHKQECWAALIQLTLKTNENSKTDRTTEMLTDSKIFQKRMLTDSLIMIRIWTNLVKCLYNWSLWIIFWPILENLDLETMTSIPDKFHDDLGGNCVNQPTYIVSDSLW